MPPFFKDAPTELILAGLGLVSILVLGVLAWTYVVAEKRSECTRGWRRVLWLGLKHAAMAPGAFAMLPVMLFAGEGGGVVIAAIVCIAIACLVLWLPTTLLLWMVAMGWTITTAVLTRRDWDQMAAREASRDGD